MPPIVGRILNGRRGCIRALPGRDQRIRLLRDGAQRINGPWISAFGEDDNIGRLRRCLTGFPLSRE